MSMHVEKKVLATLNRCYALAPLFYRGERYFLVAAEKADPCFLFDLDGNLADTVWTEPGGVMTMVQIPGSDGQFLSTARFYSPDESAGSSLVTVTPRSGGWEMRTLAPLPHVHRFDILERGGLKWLIACTVKSGQRHPHGDWSFPGKVYASPLPEDLDGFDDGHPFPLTVIRDGLHKNHGYSRCLREGVPAALISCEEGVFRLTPPETPDGSWETELLLEAPVSDAVLVDLDGDGQEELCTLAPFHGDAVSVYHRCRGGYSRVWELPHPAEFAHAIYGGPLAGAPAFVVGHRAGARDLMAIRYDHGRGNYTYETIDTGRGPANVLRLERGDGKDVLIAANRESDEVAMYVISP